MHLTGASGVLGLQRCVWAPAGGPPARYALAWSRPAPGGSGTRQEDIVPAWEVELPPRTIAPWLASPSPSAPAPAAISAETGDDFLADRHADLDVGEFGGAMTDADYYDRISGEGQNWPFDDRCPRCFGRGWLRTPDSEDYNCPTCEGTGEVTPSRRHELGLPAAD